MTGVVVTIVILSILAAIGGPPLWRLITDAREHKLNSNLQSAAQVMRDRLTLEPEWMGIHDATTNPDGGVTATTGAPTDALLTVLVEDLPFTWHNTWNIASGDGDETIKVQFLMDGTSLAEVTAAGTPPTVDWLLDDGRAVRLQSQNDDGAWACALIVMRPDTPSGALIAGRYATGVVIAPNKRTADAWIGGIWYDSGDAPSDAAGGLHNCSPVDKLGDASAAAKATLPGSPNTWQIEDNKSTSPVVVRTFSKNL